MAENPAENSAYKQLPALSHEQLYICSTNDTCECMFHVERAVQLTKLAHTICEDVAYCLKADGCA